MRIDDQSRIPVTQSGEKSEQTAQEHAAAKDAKAGADHAEVSHLAQALATPDPGRIEQLRLDVQSGSYDIAAQTVAKALIDAHLTE
jgi:anti-sigma28 factor (negative regulator of flagellin synthesis)